MKILIYKRNSLINSSGGAEKAMCTLADHFAKTGHDVLFLTRDMRAGKTFYPLDQRVTLKQYDKKYNKFLHLCGKILKKTGLIKFASFCDRDLFIADNNRKTVEAFLPDIIIATSPADAAELLYKQTGMPPVIVMLHSCPSYFFKNGKKAAQYRKILKQVAAVQVLQPSFAEELKSYYDGRIEVIGNCIKQSDTIPDYTKKRIICLARIEPDKQQYELTRAFCQIAKEFPDWHLDLYGDITHPDYKNKCVRLAETYGADKQILFHGITTDVPAALAEASVCAFPSKFEGFGMGLAEALAAGLASVGFKSASGVNELIKDGNNGFLVKDVDELAQKLRVLMTNENLRQTMGLAAKQSMKAFDPDIIRKKWDNFVSKTLTASSLNNIPIYIISFNRLSCLEQLVLRLEKAGCTNIHIVDNASTYPPLSDYLAHTKHTVHRMDKNYGHRVLFEAPEFKEIVDNHFFVLTDPDIVPTADCPDDFMSVFFHILQNNPFADKVGFSLKIDDLPDDYALKEKVIKWETPFYSRPIKKTSDPVLYKAPIDTTFALYRPRKDRKIKEVSIRTGFPYQARHLPWYKNLDDLTQEDRFYNALDSGSGNWNGTKNADFFQITQTFYIKLFGFLPVIKIKHKRNKKTFLLFCFLPIFRIKEKSDSFDRIDERESLAMSKALSLKTKEKDSIFSRNSRSPLWEPNK